MKRDMPGKTGGSLRMLFNLLTLCLEVSRMPDVVSIQKGEYISLGLLAQKIQSVCNSMIRLSVNCYTRLIDF